MIRTLAASAAMAVAVTFGAGARQTPAGGNADQMSDISKEYVRLVLAMGDHDKDYVDAYYGPADLKTAAAAAHLSLDAIGAGANALQDTLTRTPAGSGELEQLRHQYLQKQLSALSARVRLLKGEHLPFDTESKALYDAVAPTYSEAHFQEVLDRLDKRFPGSGPLVSRYDAWRRDFIIPREKLDAVFKAAIAACREQTLKHVRLPQGESFTVEYVTNKSWSGYNWYQGGYRSLIQVNADLPIYIDRAVNLACHEGYPG